MHLLLHAFYVACMLLLMHAILHVCYVACILVCMHSCVDSCMRACLHAFMRVAWMRACVHARMCHDTRLGGCLVDTPQTEARGASYIEWGGVWPCGVRGVAPDTPPTEARRASYLGLGGVWPVALSGLSVCLCVCVSACLPLVSATQFTHHEVLGSNPCP